MAEVFRRGLEYMTLVNPVDEIEKDWELPVLQGERFSAQFDDLDFKELPRIFQPRKSQNTRKTGAEQ